VLGLSAPTALNGAAAVETETEENGTATRKSSRAAAR
jgi:hypothetical protein